MNTISRTAKILDKACACLYWIFNITTVILFFAVIFLIVTHLLGIQLIKANQSFTLSLGDLQLLLAPGVLAEITSPGYEKTLLLTAVFALCSMPVYLIMLLTVRDVLKPFIRREPFHETVAKDLKRLAILLTIDTALSWIATGLMNHMTRSFLDIEKLFLDGVLFGDRVIAVGIADMTFDATPLLFAGALYLLSKVFLYGQELQTLSDETL